MIDQRADLRRWAMSDAIRRLVDDLLAAWNDHDPKRAETFYAIEYEGIDVGMAQPQRSPGERTSVLASYVRAFPDFRITGETLVDGNQAVLIWTLGGTHKGKFMGIPATGYPIELRGVSVMTVIDNKIT